MAIRAQVTLGGETSLDIGGGKTLTSIITLRSADHLGRCMDASMIGRPHSPFDQCYGIDLSGFTGSAQWKRSSTAGITRHPNRRPNRGAPE